MPHKHLFTKLMNADDAPHLVDEAECINMENLRFGTTNDGGVGELENIKGTLMRFQSGRPVAINGAVTYQCVGATADEANRFIVWFVHSPATDVDGVWDSIYLYDKVLAQTYYVLDTGVAPTLNLNPAHLIDSHIVNDCLYWTDNYNEPRMIHLGTAMRIFANDAPIAPLYVAATPLTEQDLGLIRQPFAYAPLLTKKNNPAYSVNRIEKESFQFAVECLHWNGERTVLSTWSKSSKLNGATDITNNLNYITVSLPSSPIPQAVRIVRLICIIGSTKNAFVANTWDKKIAAQATEITNHNTGSALLSFDFYNNAMGEYLDAATIFLPFHSVPLLSKTLCPAKNRIFLGGNNEGYDTPSATSLAISVPAAGSLGNNTFQLLILSCNYLDEQGNGDPSNYIYKSVAAYGLQFSDGKYYYITATKVVNQNTGSEASPATGSLGGAPASAAMSGLTELGAGLNDVAHYLNVDDPFSAPQGVATISTQSTTLLVTGLIGEGSSDVTQYKSGGEYQFGIVFYDEALRKCGVLTDVSLRQAVANRDYGLTTKTPSFNWSLSNTSAAAEIPVWAAYYSIVRTLNLKTRFFVQDFASAPLAYYKKDATGVWSDTTVTTYDNQVKGIGFDISSLIQAGLGYSFTDGDLCFLYDNATPSKTYELPVLEVINGSIVIVKPVDMGSLLSRNFGYEIYTPYQVVSNEPYYEVGSIYAVSNPHQSNRAYSALGGTLNGDVSLVTRLYNSTNYDVEVMCPNDKFWKRWDTDAGRINIVTTSGNNYDKTGVRYSDTFIPGTSTNGLSSFEALNQSSLPMEMGELQKLTLTVRAQSEGSVMLAIGSTETASLYLGTSQLSDAAGNVTLIRSVGVIGQVNILQGSMGTMHPESVASFRGRIFWLDVINGVIASYSDNGLFPVSGNKLRRATAKMCRRLDGSTSHVPGGIDPYHGEYLISVPQTESTPPLGTLGDLDTPIDFPYDFYDGKAKAWVYKIDYDKPQGSQRFVAEYFVSLGNALFSFKNGTLYEHNAADSYDLFYGEAVTPRIAFTENGNPDSDVKIFKTLSLEANLPPSFTHIRTEVPYIQSSDLTSGDWVEKEGVYDAGILRDRLSPNTEGDANGKLFFGDVMRGQYAKVLMDWNTAGALLKVRYINVNYSKSSGHNNI